MDDSPYPDRDFSTCEEVMEHLRIAFTHHGYSHRLSLANEVPAEPGCPCHTVQAVDSLPGPQEREVAALELADQGRVAWQAFAGWTLSQSERLKMLASVADADAFAHWPDQDKQR